MNPTCTSARRLVRCSAFYPLLLIAGLSLGACGGGGGSAAPSATPSPTPTPNAALTWGSGQWGTKQWSNGSAPVGIETSGDRHTPASPAVQPLPQVANPQVATPQVLTSSATGS